MATKNKYTDIDLSKYDNGYQASDKVNSAYTKKTAAEDAVNNYGDFNYANEQKYNDAMNAILNRKNFSYDLNGDALYQQYKDNYMTQGKQASMDVMGQVSAMTGGYGNSYAATVGNQTYQGYLQKLNDVVPQLYQLALDRYNSEGEQLKTNYNLLNTDRSNAYGEYNDKYNRLLSERDYASNDYNNVFNQDYGMWNDNRTYDTGEYWNQYNAGYQAEQDAFNNDLALKNYNLNERQVALSENQYNDSKKVVNNNTTPTVNYSEIPDSVISKAEGLGNDIERANYLQGLVNAGAITNDQKNAVLAQTIGNDTIEYDGSRYAVIDNGGANGFLGLGKLFGNIDNNAKVMDENGNTYTMEQLYKMKQNEGMTPSEAKAWVVALQKAAGVH